MSNRFLVSVANAVGRDPITKQAIFLGKANITSAFTLAMSETEVRGGINNSLLFTYKHTRSLSVNITQVVIDKSFLALNTGSHIQNGVPTRVVTTECQTLSGTGTATLNNVPTDNDKMKISIRLENGNIVFPETLVGSLITYADGANQKVDVIYEYTATIDALSIEATTPPNIIDLTLTAEIRDSEKGLVEYQQINIPSFQIDGNYELSFSADGVSQEALTGKALRVDGATCADGDTYAYVKWIPVSGSIDTLPVSEIATTPENIVLATAETAQLSTKALYGAIYTPTAVTTGLSYTVTPTGKFTVSAGGLVTAGTVTASDTATIEVTYTVGSKTYKDYVFAKGK